MLSSESALLLNGENATSLTMVLNRLKSVTLSSTSGCNRPISSNSLTLNNEYPTACSYRICINWGYKEFKVTRLLIGVFQINCYCSESCYSIHGSHFFRPTNFPDCSSIFRSFPVFFEVHFCLKYGTIFAGFSLLLADKFP